MERDLEIYIPAAVPRISHLFPLPATYSHIFPSYVLDRLTSEQQRQRLKGPERRAQVERDSEIISLASTNGTQMTQIVFPPVPHQSLDFID